jgi:hypothetical protein
VWSECGRSMCGGGLRCLGSLARLKFWPGVLVLGVDTWSEFDKGWDVGE